MYMRTTVSIDDEVLSVARALAEERELPLGRVLSDLAKKGLEQSRMAVVSDGFPVFHVKPEARVITLADVKRAEDEP